MSSDSHYLKEELYRLIQSDPAIFEFLQQGSLDGIWYWDLQNSAHEWMSPQFWTVLGYDPDEKKPLSSEWQDLINPDDLQTALDNFSKHCADPDHPYDQIVRYRHRDGSTVWVRCRGIVIRDESGTPIRMLGAHNDLTEQKRVEDELRRSEERMTQLYQNVPIGYQSLNQEGVLLEVNDSWCTLLGYTREEAIGRNYADFLSAESRDRFDRGFPPDTNTGKIRGVEFEILKKDGSPLTVTVNGRIQYNDDGSFRQTHCVLDDITEKKQWESRLRAVSRLSESMVEHSPRGICLYDADGNCIAANSLAGEIIGATKEQVLEQNYNSIESWKKSGLLKAAQDTVKKRTKNRIEVAVTSTFGTPCMIEIHMVPLVLENEVHLLTMFEDVSDIRQAEWRNARLSRIIEDSVNEIYLFDPESLTFTEVNNAALSNLGYSREELLGLSPVDLKPEYTSETFADMIAPLRSGYEEKLVFETIHRRRDGSCYDIEVHLQLLSHAGKKMFVAIILDISERKQAQRKLLESEKNYRMLVENQSDLVVKVDTEGRFLFVSPSYCRVFGRDEEALLGRTFMPLVHEDDRESTQKAMERLYVPPYTAYLEQRALTTAGWRWFSWVDTAVLDENGDVKEIIGVGRDINDTKLAQEEVSFLSEIIQQSSSPVITTGLDFKIIWVNNAFTEMFGYTLEDVIGRTPEFLNTEPISGHMQREVYETVSTGGRISRQARNRRKDGTTFLCQFDVFPILDGSGNITAYSSTLSDLSKEEEAEEALASSERYYRTLMQSLHDNILVIDRDYRITDVNDTALVHLGRKRNEVLGKHCYDVYHDFDTPCFEKGSECGARIVFEKGSVYELVYEHTGGDGRTALLDVQCSPFRDEQGTITHVVEVSRDITETYEARKALQKSEEQYRQLFENASDAIFIAQDHVVKFPNHRTTELLGYTEAELLQVPFIDFIHPDDRQVVMSRHVERLRGEAPQNNYTIRIIDKMGKELIVQLNTVLVDWQGRPATLCFLRDITQQKLLEDDLRQAQKMEAVGTLAGGIAHDFNNILASIIGYAELGLDDVARGSHLEDDLLEILNAGKRARDLVKQILTFARQTDTAIRPVDIATIASEALKFLRSSIPTTIDITHHFDSTSLVMGDPTQVHQIIMNLVTNAAQAMDGEKGLIEVGLRDVTIDKQADGAITALPPGTYLELSVADTGPGIPAEIIDSIFEPYFTTKEPGKGTGMGLAMVHGIIHNYGGTITAQSVPGKRTVFSALLPTARKSETERTTEDTPLPTGTESILFVDDEQPIAKLSRQILSRLGYRVSTRTSSVEALELFRSAPDRFDLVITDMTMPNMTGDQLASALLAIRPKLPVIISTGYSEKITESTAARLGVRGLVYKPIVKSKLAEVVRRVLDER